MKTFHFHHVAHHLGRHNLHLFELSVWLHVLGRSIVSVFIPILLLQKGFAISEVVWYYALYYAIDVPLNLLVDRAVRRFGAVRGVMAGNVATISFLILLSRLLPGNWPMLLALAACAALYDTFYWISHMYLFAKAEGKEGDAATDTGTLYIVRILGRMAGPIIGAALVLFASKDSLIFASIFILLLSLLPLLSLRDIEDKPHRLRRVPIREFFKDPRERSNYASMFFYCFHDSAENILWPLFVFTVFGTMESVALLAVIVACTSVVFSYAAGRFARRHPKSLIAAGSLLIAFTWMLRLGSQDPRAYYASLVIMGFLALITTVPIEANILKRAKETETLSAMTYRNASTMLSPFLMFLTIGILVDVFKAGFLTAAASMFLLALFSMYILVSERRLPDQVANEPVKM